MDAEYQAANGHGACGKCRAAPAPCGDRTRDRVGAPAPVPQEHETVPDKYPAPLDHAPNLATSAFVPHSSAKVLVLRSESYSEPVSEVFVQTPGVGGGVGLAAHAVHMLGGKTFSCSMVEIGLIALSTAE